MLIEIEGSFLEDYIYISFRCIFITSKSFSIFWLLKNYKFYSNIVNNYNYNYNNN